MSEIFLGMFFVTFMTLLIVYVYSCCVTEGNKNTIFETMGTASGTANAILEQSASPLSYYNALSNDAIAYTREMVAEHVSCAASMLSPASDIHAMYENNPQYQKGNIVVYTYFNDTGMHSVAAVRSESLQWTVLQ